MLSTSFEFRTLIAQNTKVEVKATLYVKRTDGGAGMRAVSLTGPDFMSGEWSFNDAVSSAGSFDVGSAIINQFEFTLNNYTRKFDDYDFTGGYIDPYVGVRLSNGSVEWLRKGRFYIEQPETYGSTIHIKALDAMCKLERPYNEVTTRYPASLRTIVMNICTKCGVTLNNTYFVNNDFVVQERPDDDSLTCLAMLSYAAQASGNWARFNNQGYLRLDWYNTAAFESEDWLDGGTYTTTTRPFSDGDTADGGNFTDYGSGDTVEGGEFGSNVYASIFAYSSASIVTDDVVITGVRVTAQDKEQDEGDDLEGETSLYGSEGYVLEFPDNPLIQYGTAADVAERVGKRVVGMAFRPFDVSALGDPSIEAGDPIILTDHLQNQYRSYITTLTYKVGSYETYACNAETPSRHSASSYSTATRAVVKLRNQIDREKTDRERAIENLAELLANSSGLYMTKQAQSDGSNIYYMHDKPTLAESQIVWKLTANAFGISTDGGRTYPYSLDVNGDAILNRIYAIGLDADYITTGALVVKNSSGTTIFSADKDTKQVYISGDCITIGSESLPTAIKGIRALYGTCNTAAGTATKVVTCSDFQLRTGAVVNVKFTYKNTASQPKLNVNDTGAKSIYINGAVMTSDYYWNANDIVTFVYNGTYWYIADSGTLAKIKTTSDSIVLSVSQTYATKSELAVGLNSISLSVSNAKLGSTASITLSANGSSTTKTIDLTGVRNAFKNDTTAITISAGTVTFNSNTFVVNSTNFNVTSTGVVTAKGATIEGAITIKLAASELGTGSEVWVQAGSFSDSVHTYYGTYSGTKHGLQASSHNSTSSNDNSIIIIPGRKASTTLNAALIASRSQMVIAAETSNAYGPYLGLIKGDTCLANDAGYSKFSRVRLENNEISFYVWQGSSGFNAMRIDGSSSSQGVIVQTGLYVSGTKSRLVESANYGRRLYYCYETSTPTFGDLGSGITDDEGICYVSIDDIFAEVTRTDCSYQVFLQKCGAGDLWVSEKHPGWFVVEGTPHLAFDWEVKCVQAGYENTRTESPDALAASGTEDLWVSLNSLYEGEMNIEAKLEEELLKEEA